MPVNGIPITVTRTYNLDLLSDTNCPFLSESVATHSHLRTDKFASK